MSAAIARAVVGALQALLMAAAVILIPTFFIGLFFYDEDVFGWVMLALFAVVVAGFGACHGYNSFSAEVS